MNELCHRLSIQKSGNPSKYDEGVRAERVDCRRLASQLAENAGGYIGWLMMNDREFSERECGVCERQKICTKEESGESRKIHQTRARHDH